MKIGTQVVMINCMEARTNPDKVWTTRSEPWSLGHGEMVVLLEGKSGGFAVDRLKVVGDPVEQ